VIYKYCYVLTVDFPLSCYKQFYCSILCDVELYVYYEDA
jgi:hypothetical protein